METLRIAMAQINPTVGDLKGNREKIVDFIRRTQTIGADIVTFPELALTGYPPEDLLLKKHFIKNNLEELKSIVKIVRDVTVIIGFVDMDKKGNVYNAAAVINNGRIKGVYHKINLPNYGVFDEIRYFHPGKGIPLFRIRKITFGVNICEDVWCRNGVAKLQANKGARLIINISASPYNAGKKELRKNMLIERAKETGACICYNNLVGGQDELVFDGAGLMVDSKGNEIVAGKQFEEDLVMADLSVRSSSKAKYGIGLAVSKDTKRVELPKREYKKLDKIEEIYNALVLGTRDYIRKNGFKKAVIGLSGGIDSSLTAAIACDAIGNENVIGISMPSRYSSQGTQDDAKTLVRNLDIRLITVPIESIFDIYLMIFDKHFMGLSRDVTEENLQARIRGNILMAFSNKFGWLVLTTGNKSETSVGYCTLYGDMAGGFAVIKDLPKTLVYRLAKHRNKKADKELIPESVFTREPSAELKADQKDRDTLPPYPVLDKILKEYVERDKGFKEIVSSIKFNPEIVKDIIRKVDANEYKRRQGPPGVRITPKAFGRDRRLPITNMYRE